jgi:hypothetical protein
VSRSRNGSRKNVDRAGVAVAKRFLGRVCDVVSGFQGRGKRVDGWLDIRRRVLGGKCSKTDDGSKALIREGSGAISNSDRQVFLNGQFGESRNSGPQIGRDLGGQVVERAGESRFATG